MHPAELYNKAKDHCLSVYHKYNLNEALKTLNKYSEDLPYPAWIGLKAELIFYSRYFHKYTLDPANDHGIKADFIGDIEGKRYRIDVTTNIEFKKLENYEPIMQKSDRLYKIAVMNPDTFELEGFYDLNFPYDASRKGRLFDVAIFMPASYNSHGDCRYNYYQKIVSVGSSNPEEDFTEQEICTDWYLPDIGTQMQDIYDAYGDDPDFDIKTECNDYLSSSARLLSKSTGRHIVACGCCHRQYLNPKDCDDEYINTQLVWIDPVVESYLPEFIDIDLSD